MNIDLKGKNAVVCGSTQGIGKAAALELASMGASVVLIARNESSLKKVKEELPVTSGQMHSYIVADFSDYNNVKTRLDQYLTSNRQTVHILVNNTGGPPAGKALDALTQEFIAAFNNHLLCNHVLVQTFAEGMKAAKYGRIINVISTSVKQPIPGLGVSNTIRGAVASWSKTLAAELAPFGITVNNVLPGGTNTQRLQSIIETNAGKAAVSKDHIQAHMLAEIPAGRFAEAAEVANAIAFLASPAASYITGINLPVDGGRTSCL